MRSFYRMAKETCARHLIPAAFVLFSIASMIAWLWFLGWLVLLIVRWVR